MSIDLWLDRDRLELYAVACLALEIEPTMPGPSGPILAVHRRLKDAAEDGHLKVSPGKEATVDIWSKVTPPDLRAFAEKKKDGLLLPLCERWEKRLAEGPTFPKESGRAKAGREWKYDWIEIMRQAGLIAFNDGIPETAAEFIGKVADWCGENWRESPSETELKRHLTLFVRLLQEKGGK
jgi:hypothetical protein